MDRNRHTRLVAIGAFALLCGGGTLAVSGCGSRTSDRHSASAGTSAHQAARYEPARFVDPTKTLNPWLPLEPGTQWVRQGRTDVGHRPVPHRVISTVTDVTKMIDGVQTITVLDRDVDAGQTSQESLDYFGADRQGNVWFMGSYTEEYEGGRLITVPDAWLTGVNGGKAGIQMLADPTRGGGAQFYSVARPPGADADVAQVVKTGQHQCVPFKCYDGVTVVREGKASAPDNEFKYYVRGVGQILNTPRSASAHHDVEDLINLTRLSPRGLADASKEALKLDRNAARTKPAVYGAATPARRSR